MPKQVDMDGDKKDDEKKDDEEKPEPNRLKKYAEKNNKNQWNSIQNHQNHIYFVNFFKIS